MRRILITGVCGFVGHSLANRFRQSYDATEVELVGLDNLTRSGAHLHLEPLRQLGVRFIHGDVRQRADLEAIDRCDWIIDAAANASVLAGLPGHASSRQLIETNLYGTIELLELCKRWGAGMILLSTSRVYSLRQLAGLPISLSGNAYWVSADDSIKGVSRRGVDETFSTRAPISLYGGTKLASEQMALEYALTFGFPLLINRCGVMAGAGQFGRADQGIFSFWLHSWHARQRLRMIGFDGRGHQVRDCLHPDDLFALIDLQMQTPLRCGDNQTINVSGGAPSARSLRQLSDWCRQRWGENEVSSQPENRPFDVPWLILDSTLASQVWGWSAQRTTDDILVEIAEFAEANPDWLQASAG